MSYGTQQFSSLCISTGMPPPLLYTEMRLFSASIVTCTHQPRRTSVRLAFAVCCIPWSRFRPRGSRTDLHGVHGLVALLVVRGVHQDLVKNLVQTGNIRDLYSCSRW